MRSDQLMKRTGSSPRPGGKTTAVDLPHTWNNIGNQDSGTRFISIRRSSRPFDKDTWLGSRALVEVWNASAKVALRRGWVARRRRAIPPSARIIHGAAGDGE